MLANSFNMASMAGVGYAASNPEDMSASRVRSEVRRQTDANPDTVRDAAAAAASSIATGDPAQTDLARERAAQALAQSRGIPIDQARAEVRDNEVRIRQSADATAKNVSRAALVAAIALILGGVAAWIGGRIGTVKPTVTSARLRAEQLH